jgi:Ni,Fe-hydrogenase I cytochrome b subunit
MIPRWKTMGRKPSSSGVARRFSMGSFSLFHWVIVLLVVVLLFGGGRISGVYG